MRRIRRAKGTGSLFKHKDSRFWWMRFSINGKEYRESTHQTNWNEATKVLNARSVAIRAGKEKPNQGGVRVNDLLDGLARDYELHERASSHTVEGHIRVLRKALGTRRAAEVRYDDLEELAVDWQKDDLANATLNRRLAALRRAYTLGRRAGKISDVPDFPHLKEDNVRQGFVEPAGFARFLSHLPDDGLRDFVEWLGFTGQRRGEAMKLQWSYLHKTPTGYELRIPASDTKNQRPRVIPVVARLAEIVSRRRKARLVNCLLIFHRNGKRIWEFRKSWRAAAEAAALDFLPHDLRRSAIRNLVHAGVDQATAMRISGHQTAAVFRRYQIVTTEDQAKALERVTVLHRTATAQGKAKATAGPDGTV